MTIVLLHRTVHPICACAVTARKGTHVRTVHICKGRPCACTPRSSVRSLYVVRTVRYAQRVTLDYNWWSALGRRASTPHDRPLTPAQLTSHGGPGTEAMPRARVINIVCKCDSGVLIM